MATEYWYPETIDSHDINQDNWIPSAGGNENINTRPGGGRAGPLTHDDDSSYISTASGSVWQDVNLDWPSPMISYDGVLTATWRHRTTAGTPQRRLRFRRPSGSNTTDIRIITDANRSYQQQALLDVSTSTHNPSGVAWVLADFDDNASTNMSIYGPSGVLVTSIWGEIGFSAPAGGGGILFLLGLAGAAALPFVGTFLCLSQLHEYLEWRRLFHPRHTVLSPAEVSQAWTELKTYRHPAFFLPAVS